MTARRARRSELRALGEMLARAFDDDPFAAWLWPPEGRPPGALRRFYTWRLRSLIAQGEVWTTDEHAGAAAWALPGRWRLGPRAALGMLRLAPSIGRPLGVVREGLARIDHAHPAEPHLHLALLGTAPERRHRGVGSGLLEPVLARCDAEGVPAYLESSNERNVPFYERHGFRKLGEVPLPDGPAVYPMWRDPGAGAEPPGYSPSTLITTRLRRPPSNSQ